MRLDDHDSLMALSPVLRYEGFFYAFEASLILINSLLWNIWHIGRHLPRDDSIFLAPDGRTEFQRDKKPDDRTLLAKTGSMLTFGFLFRKREHMEDFDNHSLPDA